MKNFDEDLKEMFNSISENIYPDEETAFQMVRWGKEQGAEPTGVLYSNNMTSFLGEDSNIYFLELYMPVK